MKLFLRKLSTTRGRPFKLSPDEAVEKFQAWSVKFIPVKITHILSINFTLLPFYAITSPDHPNIPSKTFYGGVSHSDLLVSALKSHPSTWEPFDTKQLTLENVQIDSWGKSIEEASLEKFHPTDTLHFALLPGFEIVFFRRLRRFSAFVCAQTGKVSGLRQFDFESSLNDFLLYLPSFGFNKKSLLFLPPVGLALGCFSVFRMVYSPSVFLYLSRNRLFLDHPLVIRQFGVFDPEEQVSHPPPPPQQPEEIGGNDYKALQEVLGIKHQGIVSVEDIQKAYRTALLRYHPDHFHGDPKLARKRTQEIIVAFRALNSALKRRT